MVEKQVDRRLAAILAADVVGYSRLIGADEEGTLARINDLRRDFWEPKIAEHRGRIVRWIGDGVLIEFASVCALRVRNSRRHGRAQPCSAHRQTYRVAHRHPRWRYHHRQ